MIPRMRSHRVVPALRRGAFVASGAATTLACGPSFQAIYEGNARFEHCYALEENPQASIPDKASCWRDWSERYTYGQTRDRIHYATARYVALSEARQVPTDEALMMAAPGETPRATTITAPTPTNAFAPPPKVLDLNEGATTGTDVVGVGAGQPLTVPVTAAAAPIAPPTPIPGDGLPASPCAETCANDFVSCSGPCAGDRNKPQKPGASKTCAACEPTYRTCMRGCFK